MDTDGEESITGLLLFALGLGSSQSRYLASMSLWSGGPVKRRDA